MTTSSRNEFEQELQRITSRQLWSDECLDDEATLLREAWLALSELLEAGAPQTTTVRLPQPLETLAQSPSARRPFPWMLLATSIAALLLAVAAGRWMFESAPLQGPSDQVNRRNVADAHGEIVPSQQQPAGREPATVDPLLAWEDPLADQLAQTQYQLEQLQARSSTVDVLHGMAVGYAGQLEEELARHDTL